MRKERTFTFRNILMATGIPSNNENNWRIGQMLRGIAGRKGVEAKRILAEKTNPLSSVGAMHCIAHYPVSMYEESVQEIKGAWTDDTRQLTMSFAETTDPHDTLDKIHSIAVEKWSEGADDGWLKIMQLADPGNRKNPTSDAPERNETARP